jgi:AbiV
MKPRHFIVAPDRRYRIAGGEAEGKLDKFEDKEAAAKVYAAFVHCHNNAVDLIDDAEILFAACKYARSFALAIVAWEELGKSQIAADFWPGVSQSSSIGRIQGTPGQDFLPEPRWCNRRQGIPDWRIQQHAWTSS